MNIMRWLSAILIVGIYQAVTAIADANPDASAAKRIYADFSKGNMDIYGASAHDWAPFYEEILPQAGKTEFNNSILESRLGHNESLPAKSSVITRLASLITMQASSDSEKLLLLHNFVLWRMTHAAHFSKAYASADSLATRKGQLSECIDRSFKSGMTNAWIKPPKPCGLVEDIDVGDNQTLALLFTGLHNCWGYATLFATLARASGFPTQVVQTTQPGSKHLWNRVYFRGTWLVVDTTLDDIEDVGLYEDNSSMAVSLSFFLIDDAAAARLAPESHVAYRVIDDKYLHLF